MGAADYYYSACDNFDQHIRFQQQNLCLKKNMGTHYKYQRLNFTLLVMCIVDYWLLYGVISFTNKVNQNQYYINLTTEFIDNKYYQMGCWIWMNNIFPSSKLLNGGEMRMGVICNPAITKKSKTNRHGVETSYTFQGKCRKCGKRIKSTSAPSARVRINISGSHCVHFQINTYSIL